MRQPNEQPTVRARPLSLPDHRLTLSTAIFRLPMILPAVNSTTENTTQVIRKGKAFEALQPHPWVLNSSSFCFSLTSALSIHKITLAKASMMLSTSTTRRPLSLEAWWPACPTASHTSSRITRLNTSTILQTRCHTTTTPHPECGHPLFPHMRLLHMHPLDSTPQPPPPPPRGVTPLRRLRVMHGIHELFKCHLMAVIHPKALQVTRRPRVTPQTSIHICQLSHLVRKVRVAANAESIGTPLYPIEPSPISPSVGHTPRCTSQSSQMSLTLPAVPTNSSTRHLQPAMLILL